MRGDADDVRQRLFRWLPSRWFPAGSGTRIYALLSGFATAFAQVFQQIEYTRNQSRLATSTEGWLDLTSYDFFRGQLPRRQQETDDRFRLRIGQEVFRERNTRHAIDQAIIDLTGHPPILFEPWNTFDTGGWDTPAMGWDEAGAWGDVDLMYQIFVNAFRPSGQGIPSAGGWDTPSLGWDAWGEWTDDTMIIAAITDSMIYAAVSGVVPAGMIAWVGLFGAQVHGIAGLDFFRLNVNVLGSGITVASPTGEFSRADFSSEYDIGTT